MKTLFLKSFLVVGLLFQFSASKSQTVNSGCRDLAKYYFNGNANDTSGEGNHGIVYGATPVNNRYGKKNSAYRFDGVDDYIDLGNDPTLKRQIDFTISGWVWLNKSASTTSIILSNRSGITGSAVRISRNQLEFVIGKYNHVRSFTVFSLYKWYHFAITYQHKKEGPNIAKVYINGVLENVEFTTNIRRVDTTHTFLGFEPDSLTFSDHFKGRLDDIRIQNCELSEKQVQNLYGIPQPTHTLVLQPDTASKDSKVVFYNGTKNTNFGNTSDLTQIFYSFSLIMNTRSFIQFDLSTIPSTATILDARLSLFSRPEAQNTINENSFYISRVTAPWIESQITWNNQPAYTTENQLSIPPKLTSPHYPNLDVTSLVQDMVVHGNYGFMFRLRDETPLRWLDFASGDHPDSNLHPKLAINFTGSALRNGKEDFNSLKYVSLYPNVVYEESMINIQNTDQATMVLLYDLTGSEIKKIGILHNTSTFKFESGNITKGLYIYKIYSNNLLLGTGKFIIE